MRWGGGGGYLGTFTVYEYSSGLSTYAAAPHPHVAGSTRTRAWGTASDSDSDCEAWPAVVEQVWQDDDTKIVWGDTDGKT